MKKVSKCSREGGHDSNLRLSPILSDAACCKDGLLLLFFLLALAGLMTASLFALNWLLRSLANRSLGSQKQATFSKGANR